MAVKVVCVVNDVAMENRNLRSEHGLSLWIETDQGVVLYDTGKSDEVLLHNAGVLNLNLNKVQALVLSHAHRDHTGGLGAILEVNPACEVYAHSSIIQQRYSLQDGEYKTIGMSTQLQELLLQANHHFSAESTQVLPNLWTAGEVVNRLEPEGRSANHYIKTESGFQPDEYRDDLSLVLKTNKGLRVMCGCCHAGLLNTLLHIKEKFNQPIISVVGGTHLLNADKQYLSHVIEVLNEHFPPIDFYLNHCTGEDAIRVFQQAFANLVNPFPAGSVVEFND